MRPLRATVIERRLAYIEARRKWEQRTGCAPAYLTLTAGDAYAVAGGTLSVYREMRRGESARRER